MGAQQLLYKMMVLCPIFLIAWIGGTGRFSADNFQPIACSVNQQAAIDAYRPYVAEVRHLTLSKQGIDAYRRVARHWIEASQRGELLPLTRTHVKDSLSSGVKLEILDSCESLAYRLTGEVRRSRKSADASDLILAMKLLQILKGSDPTSERLLSLEQQDILRQLSLLLPRLPKERLPALREQVSKVIESNRPIHRLVRQTGALLAKERSSREVSEMLEQLQTETREAHKPGALLAFIKNEDPKLADLPSPIAELYLAIMARDAEQQEANEVIASIDELLNPKDFAGVNGT